MPHSLPLVVVIPGIGGSELADASGTIVYRAGLGPLARVGLDPSVLDPNNELRPVGLIGPCSLICWQLITGYDGLLNGITKGLGLSPERVVTAGEDLVDRDATVVAFPYDFRRSVEQIANDLDRVVRERARGRRVVLVAHSMGGLVAAWWWAFMSVGIDVDQIITLGTPFRGAAKALNVLVNGMRIGPFDVPQALTDTVRTWDSVFDLLPHYQVVDGNTRCQYPYELPSGITSAITGFSGKARAAYEKNRCLHDALLNRVVESGHNPFTVYYSQGHATLGHASIDAHSNQLVVAKGNPLSQRAGIAATGRFRCSRRFPILWKETFPGGGDWLASIKTWWKRSQSSSICRNIHAHGCPPPLGVAAMKRVLTCSLISTMSCFRELKPSSGSV